MVVYLSVCSITTAYKKYLYAEKYLLVWVIEQTDNDFLSQNICHIIEEDSSDNDLASIGHCILPILYTLRPISCNSLMLCVVLLEKG